ncbi:nuclear transport factor 2 family protein [Bailinhaonella thermotolerans]|uniref:Nuclear transport factor 2 family protein n=1 Tax=Bailinhaonella thermotolerans TaxID=1070861 RepID=A0A3A4A597_9ACTN|nr:nuclear transport factor 2 family protein [Bailinhaonella thermotolerans]RJL23051.1 nuclear transport factor 2 family protein [Bailinhaonella thermotolerans]
MYHAIVRARVRSLWRRVGSGDYAAAVRLAAPDVRFRFVGEPPLGAELRGREAFARWFEETGARLPGLRMRLTDVVVKGWPWDTTVVARLAITATPAHDPHYTNEAIQWIRLRWGRMVSDEVMEDTQRLARAIRAAGPA